MRSILNTINTPAKTLATFALLAAAISTFTAPAHAASFESRFRTTPDRIWPGRHYWPNPMENWRVRDGQLQCTHSGRDRNLHLLTHTLGRSAKPFTTSVRIERLEGLNKIKRRFVLNQGDQLRRNSAPRIAGLPLTLTAEIPRLARDGVIAAQGGGVVGYTLWMDDGKLTFTTRRNNQPQSVATEPLNQQSATIKVTLAADGAVAIHVDGEVKARGNMPGPVPNMPLDALEAGRDGGTQVGPYDGEFPFKGRIKRVIVQLEDTPGPPDGTAGFRVGINSDINDHRHWVFHGDGIDAYYHTAGRLILADKEKPLDGDPPAGPVRLKLTGQPDENANTYTLTLIAAHPETGETLGRIRKRNVPADDLRGHVALTNSPRGNGRACFGFDQWKLSGNGVQNHKQRAFGPILWTMHTLSDSRSEAGHVLKLSAQMPPLSQADSNTADLQIKRDGQWQHLQTATIDPDARLALFRVTHWNADRDTPYRVVYETQTTDGKTLRDTWAGTIRKSPDEADEVSVAGLSCQHGSGYPYGPVPDNLAKLDPDVLFFAGDQLYEGNGGYGIVRRPADKAIVSYLRKYYMHGWVFGDLMRDRPTFCIPDDHDVFQGNIWGEGGEKLERPNFSEGGYIEPVRTVNAIHRTQTAHHPGVQNLEPAKRGISVFYGDMVYGRLSMAVIADRQFKTGPRGVPDNADPEDLTLLGDRQLNFLRQWTADWRGADMKLLLSQTQWCDVNTHGGNSRNRHRSTTDTGGWPKLKRDRAVRAARKGFPFHMNGDQHLPTLVHMGVDQQRDAFWGYSPPAVAVGYPRWFVPDELGEPVKNRPAHGLPNTGEYQDGFGNPMYVYAVGNPTAQTGDDRYQRAHNKSSGFGLLRFNKPERTVDVHAYRFLANLDDPAADNQFPGWPVTVTQRQGYGRTPVGHLKPRSLPGVTNPVVKLYHQDTGELVYALRAKGNTFKPFVFEEGEYKVRLGDPSANRWMTYENQTIVEQR